MNYEVEYEENDKKEVPKPCFEKSECGEVKIKAENVFITINCKEEKEKKDYEMSYDLEYEEDDKKVTPKPDFEKSECGGIKIKAENVYININCKENKERKDY